MSITRGQEEKRKRGKEEKRNGKRQGIVSINMKKASPSNSLYLYKEWGRDGVYKFFKKLLLYSFHYN